MSGNLTVDKVRKNPGDTLTDLVRGLAKTWANVSASSGTPTARDSLNLSSITDVAVGVYELNAVAAFAAVDFSISGISHTGANKGIIDVAFGFVTVSSVRFRSIDDTVLADMTFSSALLTGDLA